MSFYEQKITELKNLIYSVQQKTRELENRRLEIQAKLNQDLEFIKRYYQTEKESIVRLAEEKSRGIPYLAESFDEYFLLQQAQIINYLNNKKRPAPAAAEAVKEQSKLRRAAEKENKQLKYLLKYQQWLFPELDQLDQDEEFFVDVVSEDQDEVLSFIPKEEYIKLSIAQRNQRALDIYKEKLKMGKISNLAKGQAYERFIGFRYEELGFEVEYFGMSEGLHDFGRDLICKKSGTTEIVQCKFWKEKYASGQNKVIYERHINQLFGTAAAYWLEHYQKQQVDLFDNFLTNKKVIPHFISSTNLSKDAEKFAKLLQVKFSKIDFDANYPMIKCTISQNEEKIYHLPFDQQYNKIKMKKDCRRVYCETVQEAINMGYRRAFKYTNF